MGKSVYAAGIQSALLTIEPQELFLKPNEKGLFSVWVRGVENLYGAELKVRYDPAIFEVLDGEPSQEGVQVALTDVFREGFVAVNQVDQKHGTIIFAATRVNPAPPFQGEGALIQIAVMAKTNGETDITLDGAILANRDGRPIEFEARKAHLKVSETASKNTSASEVTQSGQEQKGERRAEGEAIQPLFLMAAGGGILLLIVALLFVIRALRRRES